MRVRKLKRVRTEASESPKAEQRSLQHGGETKEDLARKQVGSESLDGEDAEDEERAGGEQREPVSREGAEKAEAAACSNSEDERPAEAVEDIEGTYRKERTGKERGELGEEERRGANGQRSEDEHIVAVGEGGVPAEHGDDACDGHGGLYKEVLKHVGERHGDGLAADEEDGYGEAAEETDGGEHGGELPHEPRGVGITGEQLEVDDAEKEDPVEDAKLEEEVLPVQLEDGHGWLR
jgi:hypothetical protein